MTQPLITTEQIDNDSLFPVGSGAQLQSVFGEILPSNGTGEIPYDNTPPLITEGTEFGVGQITRQRETSSILIQFSVTIDVSANDQIIIAVFRGSNVVTSAVVDAKANEPLTLSVTHVDLLAGGSPAEPNPLQYSGRIGRQTGGTATWYVNSTAAGNDLGGSLHSTFVLTELK